MTTSKLSRTARALTLCLLCAGSTVEAGRRVVLKADGNASADIKAKVAAQVLRLAKNVDASTELGEVTFSDAATAVGCSGDETRCRNDVVGTMAVDEFVSITVTALPNGDTHVAVRRVPKAGAIRDAQTTILAGQSIEPNMATSVGPIFGVRPKSPTPSTVTSPRPEADTLGEPPLQPSAPPAPAPPAPQPIAVTPSEGASQTEATGRSHSAKPIIGLAIGGALITTGVILWSQAAATQSDIDSAPTRSSTDFRYLRDLESRGEAFANVGNALFITGAVVAGVSGYFLWRDRRATGEHAYIGPAVFNRGAGIALTIGGTP